MVSFGEGDEPKQSVYHEQMEKSVFSQNLTVRKSMAGFGYLCCGTHTNRNIKLMHVYTRRKKKYPDAYIQTCALCSFDHTGSLIKS